jgi:transitional endoplasmic reticulum ATPase
MAPSILLIDELDAIGPRRDRMIQQHEITLSSQLLALLDGLEERGRVIVIGTTNRIQAIDPAVKRPGRFDYHIRVPLPDAEGRQAILDLYLARLKCEIALDVGGIASSTSGWSGAELEAIVREAGLMAIKRAIHNGLSAAETCVVQKELRDAFMALSVKREKKVRTHNAGRKSATIAHATHLFLR